MHALPPASPAASPNNAARRLQPPCCRCMASESVDAAAVDDESSLIGDSRSSLSKRSVVQPVASLKCAQSFLVPLLSLFALSPAWRLQRWHHLSSRAQIPPCLLSPFWAAESAVSQPPKSLPSEDSRSPFTRRCRNSAVKRARSAPLEPAQMGARTCLLSTGSACLPASTLPPSLSVFL